MSTSENRTMTFSPVEVAWEAEAYELRAKLAQANTERELARNETAQTFTVNLQLAQRLTAALQQIEALKQQLAKAKKTIELLGGQKPNNSTT